MSVDLGQIPETAPAPGVAVGGGLAQIWKNIFPWEDLNAKGPPEQWLTLGQEILPALAVLAAQGPDQPHLLQTDLLSRLLTVGSLNAVDKAADQSLVGASLITVENPELFAPGSWVAIVPAAGSSTLINSQVYQVLSPAAGPGQLNVAPALTANVNPGDFVVSVPAVWIAGQSLNVQVGNSIVVSTLPAIQIAAAQSVNIGNTVTIAGTINIGNTPSVSIVSGNVTATISGTPNITITGQTVTVAVNQPAANLGIVSAGLGVVGANATFNLPTGTHAVVLMIAGPNTPNPPAAGFANPTSITALGVQSGNLYLQDSSGSPPPWLAFSVDSAVDTQVKVILNGPTVGGPSILAQVFVGSALDTLSEFVQNTYDTALSVASIGSIRQHGGNPSPNSLPAWPVDASGTAAAAAGSQSAVVLAATPGKTYTCHSITGSFGVNVAPGGPTAQNLQVLDGGTAIWAIEFRCQNIAGDRQLYGQSDLRLRGTSGNSMTGRFAAGQGQITEVVSIGAYLQ